MEAIVGFSFTFGSFPEVTVPRNPKSGFSTFKGSTVTGATSDLIAPSLVASRVPELDAASLATGFPG